jgi:hypothetical protein
MHIPDRLFGQVAGPDNQELGKSHVSPQHNKGEEQITQIVQNARLGDLGSDIILTERGQHHDTEGENGQPLAGDEGNAIDGRKPIRFQRHAPVEGSKGHGDDIKEEAKPAVKPGAVLYKRVVRRVFQPPQPAKEDEATADPDDKVQYRSPQEEGHIQIRGFVLQQFMGRHLSRIGPEVKLSQP